MYLYFNKEGILTTSIPHGEPVRQGGFLNLYVCFDVDFFENDIDRKNHSINVELTLPTGIIGTTKCIPEKEPSIQVFRKTSDSELTYDLVDGFPYWTYHFKFTPETSTTYHGLVKANISIVKTYEDEYGDVMEIDRVQFGETQIFVEKTFGFAKKAVDNSTLHYENLIAQINEINKKVELKNENFDSVFVGENEPDSTEKTYNVWLDLGELGNDEVVNVSTFNLRKTFVETNVVGVEETENNEIIEVFEVEPETSVIVMGEEQIVMLDKTENNKNEIITVFEK